MNGTLVLEMGVHSRYEIDFDEKQKTSFACCKRPDVDCKTSVSDSITDEIVI